MTPTPTPEYICLPAANPLTAVIDENGMWHYLIFLGCVSIVVGLLYRFKRVAWEARLLWGYVLIQGIFIVVFPMNLYKGYDIAFRWTAAEAVIQAALIPLGAIFFPVEAMPFIPPVVTWCALSTWLHWDGPMLTGSFNMAFCALALPFIPAWLAWAVIVTIVTHHGATAALIVSAQMITRLVCRSRIPFKTRAIAIGLAAIATGACVWWHSTGPLFDGLERLQKWAVRFDMWRQSPLWMTLGVGAGSFMHTSFMLDGYKYPLFLQMHSDWLQIPWEYGIVGLGLTLLAFRRAIKNAVGNPNLTASLVGCAVFGLTYHPLRFFPTAFLVILIFRAALVIEE